ncbi:MAG: hypothetical protein LBG91_01985 [Treponema sp.]|nr:hypothetical protein [Treponema sp.]
MRIIRVTENLPLSLKVRTPKAENGVVNKLAALVEIQTAAEAEAKKSKPDIPTRPHWDNTIGDFIES